MQFIDRPVCIVFLHPSTAKTPYNVLKPTLTPNKHDSCCFHLNVLNMISYVVDLNLTILYNTQITLKVVFPTIFGIWKNTPVLRLSSEIRMRPCDTVAKHPLPCASYGSFKMFNTSASEFGTVSMYRQIRACTDEFLATVTEGVVHGVYKVMTQSSFGLTR